jgi:hypothetical protein
MYFFLIYTVSLHERSVFLEVIVSVILSKKVYMYMFLILNGFRDRDISLYSSKIVDKKETLGTVSNTSIYCSSDNVGTVYLLKIPSSTSMHFATRVGTWHVAHLYSEIALSWKLFGIEHVHIHVFA